MSNPTISQAVGHICTLFEERMRVKGATLERQVYKAGRRLPQRVRKAARQVVEMSAVADHPKLSRMVDEKRFHTAARVVVTHLESIDPRDVALGRFLAALGKISAVLILGFIAIVWYLWSTGKI